MELHNEVTIGWFRRHHVLLLFKYVYSYTYFQTPQEHESFLTYISPCRYWVRSVLGAIWG